jgi:8-oxo-dGTP diphosphatase
MGSIQDALKILKTDRIKNVSIINFIKNNKVLSIDIIGESVLARGTSDRRWVYISCPKAEELKGFISQFTPEDRCYGAIEDRMFPVLTEGKEILWDISVVKFYLPEEVYLPPPPRKTVDLSAHDAETVFTNSEYKKYISPEYIVQRITKGISSGIYEDNKLVSWAITQDDGAIGFLHTIEEYRKKGYGYIVTLSMIEKLRNRGELPFAYIVASNKRSIDLFLKLGFRKSNTIHWFEIK